MPETETIEIKCSRCDHVDTHPISWLKSPDVHLCSNCGANLDAKRASMLAAMEQSE